MKNILQRIIKPTARGKVWQVFILILAITVIAGLVDAGSYYNRGVDWLSSKTNEKIKLPYTKEIPFHLGLDLQGGTHLVYEADVSEVEASDKDSSVEGVRDVIERRVNIFGVSEPNVQVNHTADGKYRIIVELAGVKDVNEAIEMIGETPLLEFKEESNEVRELTEEEQTMMDEYNAEADTMAEEVLGKLLSGGDFGALAKEYSDDTNSSENNGDLGWITADEYPEIVAITEGLTVGDYTKQLLKTSYGYEIAKLNDKQIKKDPLTDEEVKEYNASHLLICYEGSESCESGLSQEEAYEKIKQIKEQATPVNFFDLVKANSTEPGADTSGGELGWFEKDLMVKPFADTVATQEVGTISYVVETKFGYHLIYKQDERDVYEYDVSHILIRTMSETDILGSQSEWKNTELTGKYLKKASVQFNANDNSPEVALEFNDEGAELFEVITEENIGNQVAIFLDGYPVSAPTVNDKISGGKAVISGSFTIQEAKELARYLNAGALPVPIELVSQKTVGASLGHDSINASLKSGLIGIATVAVFMIIIYRLFGILAVFSLSIYGILVLAIFKLWPVTLTLSGLAGFILSIGMAVDANVLIFERIKEEIKAGSPIRRAIEEGFRRAWPSIRDGNFSTLITSFILIQFSTSIVKGFAVTLSLGIIISMFSAIVITKNFLLLFSEKFLERNLCLIGVRRKNNNE